MIRIGLHVLLELKLYSGRVLVSILSYCYVLFSTYDQTLFCVLYKPYSYQVARVTLSFYKCNWNVRHCCRLTGLNRDRFLLSLYNKGRKSKAEFRLIFHPFSLSFGPIDLDTARTSCQAVRRSSNYLQLFLSYWLQKGITLRPLLLLCPTRILLSHSHPPKVVTAITLPHFVS